MRKQREFKDLVNKIYQNKKDKNLFYILEEKFDRVHSDISLFVIINFSDK